MEEEEEEVGGWMDGWMGRWVGGWVTDVRTSTDDEDGGGEEGELCLDAKGREEELAGIAGDEGRG